MLMLAGQVLDSAVFCTCTMKYLTQLKTKGPSSDQAVALDVFIFEV